MQTERCGSSSTGWAWSRARKVASTSTSSRRGSANRNANRSSRSATSSANSPAPRASRTTRTSCGSPRSAASRLRKSTRGSSGGPRKARFIAPRKTNISSSNGCNRDPADAHPNERIVPGERHRRQRDHFGQGRSRAQDRTRDSTDQAEETDPDSERRQEASPTHASPGKVEAAKEDEDAAEVRGEAEDDEADNQEEKAHIAQGARSNDVILVHELNVLVRELARKEERSGKDREDDGVPVADLPHPPPRARLRLRHRREPTCRRILMAFPCAIGPEVGLPVLK